MTRVDTKARFPYDRLCRKDRLCRFKFLGRLYGNALRDDGYDPYDRNDPAVRDRLEFYPCDRDDPIDDSVVCIL